METITKNNWAFIVKAKTSSKMHPFQSLEEAESFAAKSSNKHACYTVWQEGKCISAFKSGIKLPETKTIASVCFETPDASEIYTQCNPPKGNKWKTVDSALYRISVVRCEDKVRLIKTYKNLFLTKNNTHVCRFTNEITTLRKDGRCFYTSGRSFRSEEQMYLGSKDNVIEKPLRKALIELRPELKQVIDNCKDLYEVIYAFRYPNYYFITDDYKHLIRRRNEPDISRYIYPHTLTNENILIETIAKKIKAPMSKGLKKLYAVNKKNMLIAAKIAKCGIKTIDNIYKLSHIGAFVGNNEINLIRLIVKTRGENWFTKHCCVEPVSEIIDTYRMIRSYDIDESIVMFVIKNMRNFHELHDTILAFSRSRQIVNRKITYDKETIKRFNKQYENVRFELPPDTKDLAIIGAEMGICVGGYGDQAVRHSCTIIKMMDGKKYAACIEVHNDHVLQIKAKFNNPLQLEYKDILDRWLKEANLTADCSDYKNIGEPWDSKYNYAHINPHVFIEENETLTLKMIKTEATKSTPQNCWLKSTDDPCIMF